MSSSCIIAGKDGFAFEDGPHQGRVLVFGRDTEGLYALMTYRLAPGSVGAETVDHGKHIHRTIEETFFVQAGELEFLIGEEVFTLRAGDFVRVPPGVTHGYVNRTGDCVELLVTFVPGGFEELFVKYRSDGGDPAGGAGFLEEATRDYASVFG
jgi:quercetin dioxygenase-like cupin family protein